MPGSLPDSKLKTNSDPHKFFEERYNELNEIVDEVAEHVCSLGRISGILRIRCTHRKKIYRKRRRTMVKENRKNLNA